MTHKNSFVSRSSEQAASALAAEAKGAAAAGSQSHRQAQASAGKRLCPLPSHLVTCRQRRTRVRRTSADMMRLRESLDPKCDKGSLLRESGILSHKPCACRPRRPAPPLPSLARSSHKLCVPIGLACMSGHACSSNSGPSLSLPRGPLAHPPRIPPPASPPCMKPDNSSSSSCNSMLMHLALAGVALESLTLAYKCLQRCTRASSKPTTGRDSSQ